MANDLDPNKSLRDSHLEYLGSCLCEAISTLHEDLLRNFNHAAELFLRPSYQHVQMIKSNYERAALIKD
jgi:hypothetical protein